MKTNKTIIAIAAILLSSLGFKANAQDPNYSQFLDNPLYYNPAYAGISQGFKARFNFRKQYPNLKNDYQTYNFNTDLSIREFPGSGGLGLIFNKDKAGAGYLETTTAGLFTSVRIRVAQNVLTQVGVLSSYVQKYVDWNKFVFTDELDPRFGNIYDSQFIPPGGNTISYPDFNIGTVIRFAQTTYNNTNIVGTIGLAAHHVFEPNETFFDYNSKLPRKYVVHADIIFASEAAVSHRNLTGRATSINEQKFNPGIYYQKQGDLFETFSFGMNAYYKSLYGGLWYRNSTFSFNNSEAIIVSLGINALFNEVSRMKLVYSYDLVLNNDLLGTGGAHEISILIELDEFSLFGNKSGWGGGRFGNSNSIYEPLECSPF